MLSIGKACEHFLIESQTTAFISFQYNEKFPKVILAQGVLYHQQNQKPRSQVFTQQKPWRSMHVKVQCMQSEVQSN